MPKYKIGETYECVGWGHDDKTFDGSYTGIPMDPDEYEEIDYERYTCGLCGEDNDDVTYYGDSHYEVVCECCFENLNGRDDE